MKFPWGPTIIKCVGQHTTAASSPHHATCSGGVADLASNSVAVVERSAVTTSIFPRLVKTVRNRPLGLAHSRTGAPPPRRRDRTPRSCAAKTESPRAKIASAAPSGATRACSAVTAPRALASAFVRVTRGASVCTSATRNTAPALVAATIPPPQTSHATIAASPRALFSSSSRGENESRASRTFRPPRSCTTTRPSPCTHTRSSSRVQPCATSSQEL
mmetsp:Transcript_4842/g.19348  ORF Transcript_4842/g.19348 Transcript_4842/m.19348 type:complete len:217 (+) Transcript_4842:1073-1723(+)